MLASKMHSSNVEELVKEYKDWYTEYFGFGYRDLIIELDLTGEYG